MSATPDPTPAEPRGDAAGLEAVLAGHRLAGLNGYCQCGWASVPRGDRIAQHDAHLAAVIVEAGWKRSETREVAPGAPSGGVVGVGASEAWDERVQRIAALEKENALLRQIVVGQGENETTEAATEGDA